MGMRFFNRLRFVLIALVVVLGFASALIPVIIRTTEDAFERSTRSDIAWNGWNGQREFFELRSRIAVYAFDGRREELEAVGTAYDILVSRIGTWKAGVFGSYVRENPVRVALLSQLDTNIRSIELPIARLGDSGVDADLMRLLHAIDQDIDLLARDAYTRNTVEASANSANLRWLHLLLQYGIMALLACSASLVVLLLLQNRLLRRANEAEQASANRNAFLAGHDPLTSLPNRASLQAALVKASGPRSGSLAVMVLDLDGFKPINDVLGHKTGDQLLVSVAHRLRQIAHENAGSFAARFGGDEFVILLQHFASSDQPLTLASKVLERLREPHRIDGHSVTIDATIGIALLPREESSAMELVHRADIALNVAKARGKGTVLLFETEMADSVLLRQRVEAELAEADAQAEFEPFYQPLVDITTGRIMGVEALARWNHPKRGFVSPAEFISIAESSGRIVEIGQVMIEKACRDAMLFPFPISVSVNLSTVQLMRMDVVALVADVLKKTGLPARRLKLEITETVMLQDARVASELIEGLRAMGVIVSLDDFGTGFSSLSYLRRFGFDELKIDRSFIAGLGDRQSLAIVQTIIALAQNLDMRVVAEGIETEEQAQLIMAAGCSQGQGFLYGKPVPIGMLIERLRNGSGLVAA